MPPTRSLPSRTARVKLDARRRRCAANRWSRERVSARLPARSRPGADAALAAPAWLSLVALCLSATGCAEAMAQPKREDAAAATTTPAAPAAPGRWRPTPPVIGAAPPLAARPWLEVKLPAVGAREPHGRLIVRLRDDEVVPSRFAGVRLQAGREPVRELPVGARLELPLAVSRGRLTELTVAGVPILAALDADESLRLSSDPDGDWLLQLERQPEAAPARLTRCRPVDDRCPTGYLRAPVYAQDATCPPAPGTAPDEVGWKCVRAPRLRVQGPAPAAATLEDGSALGTFDDRGQTSLTPRALAAGHHGPWVTMWIDDTTTPLVTVGGARAVLLAGAGDSCRLWLTGANKLQGTCARSP